MPEGRRYRGYQPAGGRPRGRIALDRPSKLPCTAAADSGGPVRDGYRLHGERAGLVGDRHAQGEAIRP
jgi:hypothetical protein